MHIDSQASTCTPFSFPPRLLRASAPDLPLPPSRSSSPFSRPFAAFLSFSLPPFPPFPFLPFPLPPFLSAPFRSPSPLPSHARGARRSRFAGCRVSSLSLYIYIYIYIYTHTYICIYIYTHICRSETCETNVIKHVKLCN